VKLQGIEWCKDHFSSLFGKKPHGSSEKLLHTLKSTLGENHFDQHCSPVQGIDRADLDAKRAAEVLQDFELRWNIRKTAERSTNSEEIGVQGLRRDTPGLMHDSEVTRIDKKGSKQELEIENTENKERLAALTAAQKGASNGRNPTVIQEFPSIPARTAFTSLPHLLLK
jgi:hypothetical protein